MKPVPAQAGQATRRPRAEAPASNIAIDPRRQVRQGIRNGWTWVLSASGARSRLGSSVAAREEV
jgi:hypothetical protein